MNSLWNAETEIERRAAAVGYYERDVVVIGAGMTGILTAWYLQKAGRRVAVLEAGRIACGQTGRTTAKITAQHGMIYSTLAEKVGEKCAGLYAEANRKALEEYRRIIAENDIDCDLQNLPAYLYSTDNPELLKREAEAACAAGIPAKLVPGVELPFDTVGAVCFEDQAQFHPLKFIKRLAEDLEIFENSSVQMVKGKRVFTNQAEFLAGKIVFATHYPIRNVPGFYFLRQHQERSYVVALAGCKPLSGMYISADEDGLSLRSVGDILLLGGNAHRTGENRSGGAYGSLRGAACKHFPMGRVIAQWSAQDCMPHDQIPFIGKYSVFRRDWYVATGYQKWGMTTSMIAALLLTDMITGVKNPWTKLFSPRRLHIYAGFRNFVEDIIVSVHGLYMGWFHPETEQPKPAFARCTHMGCKLHWNPDEKSWDCPCHGSRYDADGVRLDEPARKDMCPKKSK